MNILIFDDFLLKFDIEIKAISNIDLMRIEKRISLTQKEVIMRDEEMKTIKNTDHNIIVKIHTNEGTHWVLVISRDRLGGT